MRRSTAAALLAILFLALFARLLPLARFVYWGSDVGEYHRLTEQLVSANHLGTQYDGWGTTYPYFPGYYFVTGGGAMIGLDDEAVISIIPPLLNAFSVLLVFLIAAHLLRDERAGLLAAGVLAVAMPYVYTNSHSIPSSLGSLFVLASLALLVAPPTSRKTSLVMLLPLSAALVVTHHLSTYFLIIAVLMTLVLRSLLAAKISLREVAVETVLIASLLLMALPYWLLYATPFREGILSDLSAMPWWGPFVALAVLLATWAGVVWLRRRSSWRFVPRFPGLKRSSAMLLAGLAFAFGITILFVFVSVFGTSIEVSPATALFLSPFLVLIAFAPSGRKFLDFAHGGHGPTAWLIAFILSIVAGAVIGATVLIPYRHIDFLMIPLAVMVGAGVAFLHDLAFAGRKRGMAVGVIVAAINVSNNPVAYPPPDIMAGYDEGTSSHSLVAMHWLPIHVEGLLAADHKASTLAFGFGDTDSTWDTARKTLLAPNFQAASDEMRNVNSPSGLKRVDYVLVNSDMRAGSQLYPWEPAYAMSDGAQGKFDGLPYQRFFDDGYTQVYWVNWGLT